MKTLLAILMSFIVTEAPVLAIHGGYELGGAEQATGTYAGVLIPLSTSQLNASSFDVLSGNVDFGSNSLGLFTLNIPSSGIGNGSVVIFAGSSQANGSIDALPDPSNVGGIVGVLTAQSTITLFEGVGIFGGVTTVQEITSEASGSLFATDVLAQSSNSPTGINLTGTSNVTFAEPDIEGNLLPAEQVEFEIEGFQQNSTATATTGTF